jgi:hypothetical protein
MDATENVPAGRGSPRTERPERLFTRPLVAFLLFVAAVLVGAADTRMTRPGVDQALTALRVGDIEHAERIHLLHVVLDYGLHAADPQLRLAGAMAAVALEDDVSYQTLLTEMAPGASLPLTAANVGFVDAAALGDEVLHTLLAGMRAESRGQRAEATTAYQQAVVQSQLWEMPFVGRLAADGLQRVK